MAQEDFYFIRITKFEKELGYWVKTLNLQIREVKTVQQAQRLAQGQSQKVAEPGLKLKAELPDQQANLV